MERVRRCYASRLPVCPQISLPLTQVDYHSWRRFILVIDEILDQEAALATEHPRVTESYHFASLETFPAMFKLRRVLSMPLSDGVPQLLYFSAPPLRRCLTLACRLVLGIWPRNPDSHLPLTRPTHSRSYRALRLLLAPPPLPHLNHRNKKRILYKVVRSIRKDKTFYPKY